MNADRLHDLLNGFLDGRLEDADLDELTGALDEDPEVRRAFVRAVDQHESLRSLLGGQVAKNRNFPWKIVGLVSAAAALLAAGLIYFLRDTKTEPIPMVRETPAKPKRPEPLPLPNAEPPVVPPSPQPPPPPPTPVPPPDPPPPTPPKRPEPPAPAPPPAPPTPPKPEPGKPAPPPERKETAVAIATLELGTSNVSRVAAGVRTALKPGDPIHAGDGIETGGDGAARVRFPDATVLELSADTMVRDLSVADGKRLFLSQGILMAEIAEQPAVQPLVVSTPQAEITVGASRFRLASAAQTRLEMKEGKAKLTRRDDKRTIEVAPGHFAVAAKGIDLVSRRTTRGPMMGGAALWGEDFGDARAVEKDWTLGRNGMPVTFAGALDFDLAPRPAPDAADADLCTRAAFAPPIRITADVEITQRLKSALVALRLQSWKDGKDLIHVDLDDDRYYLTVGDKGTTLDAPRKSAHRERWILEVHADGAVAFSVDGKEILRGKRDGTAPEFHLTLLAKSKRDTLAGTHARFDNLVVERIR